MTAGSIRIAWWQFAALVAAPSIIAGAVPFTIPPADPPIATTLEVHALAESLLGLSGVLDDVAELHAAAALELEELQTEVAALPDPRPELETITGLLVALPGEFPEPPTPPAPVDPGPRLDLILERLETILAWEACPDTLHLTVERRGDGRWILRDLDGVASWGVK